MKDDSDNEEKETVPVMIYENLENEEDDGFNFKALLNIIIFGAKKSNKSMN